MLLGPPGSGKSTQAERLRKVFDLAHIDIGSELRAAAEEDTPLGHQLNEIIHLRRELVPDSIVSSVLQNALKSVPAEKCILIDGAPRCFSQIQAVLQVAENAQHPIAQVIYLHLSEEVSIERISKRYICFGCRQSFVFSTEPSFTQTICEYCGGKIGRRKDDTPEGVRKRYQVFYAETFPVIEYFSQRGMLVTIDGSQDAEKIFQDIVMHIDISKKI
ncbi:MAG: adenylate kinase family protein [Minisyncoccota bacterium]